MKKKLGILLDSFPGVSKKEIEANGFRMIPLQFSIDGKDYVDDGEQFNNEQLYELVKNSNEARTSLPSPAVIEEAVETMSEEYENVIALLVSEKLSSTYQTTKTFASGKKNFHVINNWFCGDQALEMGKFLVKKAEEGASIEDLIKYIEAAKKKSLNYLIPKSLTALIKGGRLTGVKKLILNSLGLVPLLKVDETGINADGVKRTLKGSFDKVIEKLIDFIGGSDKIQDFEFKFIYAGEPTVLETGLNCLEKANIKINKVNWASATVMIHTGHDCSSIAVWPKLEKLKI